MKVRIKVIGIFLLVVVMLLLPISCRKMGNKVAGPVKPAETNVDETKPQETKEAEKPKEPVEPPKPEAPQPPPFEPIPTPPEIKNNTLAYLFREGDSLKKCKVSTQAISSVINIREVMQLTKYQDFEIQCISTNRDYLMVEVNLYKTTDYHNHYDFESQTKNEIYCLDIKNKTKKLVTELFPSHNKDKRDNGYDNVEHFECSPDNRYFVFELQRSLIGYADDGIPPSWGEYYLMIYDITSGKLEQIKKHEDFSQLLWQSDLNLLFLTEDSILYQYNLQTKEELKLQEGVISANLMKNNLLCLHSLQQDTVQAFGYLLYDITSQSRTDKVVFNSSNHYLPNSQDNFWNPPDRKVVIADNQEFFIFQSESEKKKFLYLYIIKEQKFSLIYQNTVPKNNSGYFDSFSISPDYHFVSFHGGDGQYLYNLDTQKIIVLSDDKNNIGHMYGRQYHSYAPIVGWCPDSSIIYFNDQTNQDDNSLIVGLFTYNVVTNKKIMMINRIKNYSDYLFVDKKPYKTIGLYLYFFGWLKEDDNNFTLYVIHQGSLVYKVPLKGEYEFITQGQPSLNLFLDE